MYKYLAYICFASILLLAIFSPLLSMATKNKHKYFLMYWIVLYISQLFMYQLNADVSPYKYIIGQIESSSIRVLGFTASALASISLFIYIVFSFFWTKRKLTQTETIIILTALIPNLISLTKSTSLFSGIDVFTKSMMCFIVFLEISETMKKENVEIYSKAIEGINFIMVFQVLICKFVTGHTNAYNYYYELTEEYFGFYNHPHSFTSLLWILSLFCVYRISKQKDIKLNLLMFVSNIFLIYKSGVRTYLFSLFVGLLYIGLHAFWNKEGAKIRSYVIASMVFISILGETLYRNIGAGRTYITQDFSSGRFKRWGIDLFYYFNNYSFYDKLTGAGANSIYLINKRLIGTSINSLNLFIDLLIDYGLIGLIMITYSYFMIFKSANIRKNIFLTGTMVSFFTSCLINSPVSYVPTMTMLVVFIVIMRVNNIKKDNYE